MYDLMRCCLSGGVTQDLKELKYTKDSKAVLDFSIGSNSYKKGAGEYNQKSNYFNVTVFGKSAEACKKYLVKGSRVMIDGRLDYQSWEKDGQKHSIIKVIADSVIFIGAKNQAQAQPPAKKQEEPKEPQDLPFDDNPGDDPFAD